MSSVKLHAFFGKNLGDDLMVDILLKRYPRHKFYADTNDANSNLFLKYPNFRNRTLIIERYGVLNHILNILTRYHKEDFLLHRLFKRQEQKCICGVLIGGSMYMQFTDRAERQLEWEELRFGELPRFVIGVNFGPYYTESFLDAFHGYFQRCAGATFRDKYSYELFASCGEVAYAPDVVLNLPINQYLKPASDHTVIISVINTGERKHLEPWAQDYENFVIQCCHACLQRNKKPILMSFCKQEGDERFIQKIMGMLPPAVRDQTGVFYYTGNIDEALSTIAGADYIVATRFHAMILALRFKKPFFSVAYSDKVKQVLQDLGCEAYCGMDQLRDQNVDDIFHTYAQPFEADEYIRQAIHQFDQFDRYMENVQK